MNVFVQRSHDCYAALDEEHKHRNTKIAKQINIS